MDTIAIPEAAGHVGALLRDWRIARRRSQLDVSLDVGVSTRHLSYLETGKSQPSREMLMRIAETLEMPLRERNALLMAAGFAPVYRESPLTTPEMAPVRQAIEFTLRQQEPFPAIVMNRHWDVLLLNEAAKRIFSAIKPGGPKHGNVMRQVFDPLDMRSHVGNWQEVAGDLIRHLHDEVAAAPSDTQLRELLNDVLRYPDIPTEWRTRQLGTSPLPMLTTILRNETLELRFLSTLTTFGTSRDITIDELRIECMFPVDDATANTCKALAGQQASRGGSD